MPLVILTFMFFALILVFFLVLSIYHFLNERVEFKSRSLFGPTIQYETLKGKDARRFSALNILGTIILLISLLLPSFGINLGYLGLAFCSSGLFLYVLASFVRWKATKSN